MGLHKLTAGDGYTYLTRQVAVHDATDRGHSGLGDYYSEKGESPGRWWGSGIAALGLDADAAVTEEQMRNLFGEGRHPDAERLEDAALAAGESVRQAVQASRLGRVFAVYRGRAPEFVQEVARRFTAYNCTRGVHWKTPVPAEVRSQIRTQVAVEMFSREHGRPPLDDRERAGFVAQRSRQQTTAVAGYDLAFTPVKSVSTLWALADRDVSRQVEDAHRAAVEKTLAYLEKEVLFTRRGRGGVQQVKAQGLVAALFTHRDARSGDPNLHTHVAVSNKVQDAQGCWLAVDGRVLYKAKVTLSEMYNTLIEAELVARLGMQFADRDPATLQSQSVSEKRGVREIVGVEPALATAWSRRSRAIEGRRRVLSVAFQAAHGRPPTAVESIALGQQANLETRQAKHAPRSEADQRTAWRAEAVAVLGSEAAITTMLGDTLGRPVMTQGVTDEWVATTAVQVVERVQDDRATWQVWHLRAEAQRRARAAGVGLSDLDAAVDRVVTEAIEAHSIAFADPDPHNSPASTPASLQRPDHTSVYVGHGTQSYTSRQILAAEQRLLEVAQAGGGKRISEVRVGIAVAETAANGVTLTAAQRALVRSMATSCARLQLALAPAGTGKTTAMDVLARAWRDGGGTVVGLAPSAVAAQQLRDAITTTNGSVREPVVCDTLSKLVWSLRPDASTPDWVTKIDANTLVVIDEAGMAATTDLAAAVDYVTGRGGSVRLIGDDRQLAAVAAGGILRDVAHQVGAVTLTEVRRFEDPAEAAATLAVRDGDLSALGFYADRGRIHVGDLSSSADQAYRAWAADVAAGKESVLLAPTRELVADLNTRARNDRLTAHPDPTTTGTPAVRLGDGTLASAGDVIVTRRNHRALRISNTDWVKNGDRWTIRHTHRDGSVTAVHHSDRPGGRVAVRLPSGYVAEHVQLGYATTVHAAQGITVDTSHTVLSGEEDRSLLYVATSRGRAGNHVYLAVGNDGDPHTLIRPEALIPPTALDQLAQIIGRDNSPVSATTALREAEHPATLLRNAAARYHDALTFAAEHFLGRPAMARLDQAADTLADGLTDAQAWPTLRSHLALLALDGHHPITLLTHAVRHGPLTDAHDPAAVLDARIGHHLSTVTAHPQAGGPLPWLPGIPARLVEDIDWGTYLAGRHQQVLDHTARVTELARSWTGNDAPAWAHPFLEETDAALRAQLAVWRAVHDTPDTDLRPTGGRQIGAPGDHQAALSRQVRQARPSYPFAQRSWYQALPETVRADPWATPLCQRLARLERAGLPVGDYLTHALAPTTHHGRPLPDQHQAAALWWRLVGHLGPAALHADAHSADLLQPPWHPVLANLVGAPRAEFLTRSPAWPALVAAVDEACQHHGWTPHTILSAGLDRIPTDGRLTGVEVADALVLRIAALTDPHTGTDHPWLVGEHPDAAYEDPDRLPPPDLDDLYRDTPPHWLDDAEAQPSPREPLPDQSIDMFTAKQEPSAPEESEGDPTDLPYHPAYQLTPRAGDPDEAALPEVAFSDPDEIPAERIFELNQAALAYYLNCYPRSWAPGYLRERIGTDFRDHPTLNAGYAPPGPASLIRHLTARGADLHELDQAGLARSRDRRDGSHDYVDVFRDRLIIPIRDPHHLDHRDDPLSGVIGFIGRRNPTKSDEDYAGPKYLNTKTTGVFTKGEALFGLPESATALAAGALPVLVEGALDAYAITRGSHGTAVGIAPLGTALTTAQIRLLLPYLISDPEHIAVATDADAAGWKSAQASYWRLTAADADPTHLALPDGLDPATLYETQGSAGIQAAIAERIPLGDAMIDQQLRTSGAWSDPAVRQELVTQASLVLAARPAATWPDAIRRLKRRLHLSPGFLEHQILGHSIERDRSPDAYAIDRIAEIRDRARAKNLHPNPAATAAAVGIGSTPINPRRPADLAAPQQRQDHGPPR